jgi:hypothetical protein
LSSVASAPGISSRDARPMAHGSCSRWRWA